jgi:hypothetical protein
MIASPEPERDAGRAAILQRDEPRTFGRDFLHLTVWLKPPLPPNPYRTGATENHHPVADY